MDPKIVDQPEILLAGVIGTGEKVTDVDIAGLWQYFIEIDPKVSNKVNEDKAYELHVHLETEPERHFTLIGVAVDKIAVLPVELFTKVLPAGMYAIFTHTFSEGGYGDAFTAAYAWLAESQYRLAHPFDIQVYDDRFKGPEDPESILEIHIPILEK